MKKLSRMFDKARMFQMAGVVALGTTLGATAVQAGPEHTINFNGHALNCARLQGSQDLIPNNMTCDFVEEVEQFIPGSKLTCNPNLAGDTFEAMQPAARHMAKAHFQPALFQYQETIGAAFNADTNGTTVLQELEKTHPGESMDFYLTYLAIEGTSNRVKKGESIHEAATALAPLFDSKGYKFSNNKGPTAPYIISIFTKNPVIAALLACRGRFPDPPWTHYEAR